MAKSPLMELRELNVSRQREKAEEDAPTPEAAAPTHPPAQSNTQVSNDLSKQVNNPSSDDVSTPSADDLLEGVLEEADPLLSGGGDQPAPGRAAEKPISPRRAPAPRRGTRAGPGSPPAAGYAGVKDRLQLGAGKEPLVRLSVDVTESLHMRLKQYCAANRIPSGRMLIVTLLEDFLDNEGA